MKKIKKIIAVMLIFLIIFTFSSTFATGTKTQLEIVQNDAEIKYLDNNQGNITKKIVNSKLNEGEVSVELSLNNIIKGNEEEKKYENTEIFIILEENIVNKQEKLDKYIAYLDTLTTKVFEKNSNTKIGIIGMKGTVDDSKVNENGKLEIGEKDESNINGSENNAEIVVNLTNKVEDIKSGLQNMNTSKTSYANNFQAAIRLANKSYSKDVNKILISLYDAVPDIAIGVKAMVSYGGTTEYRTVEEAVKGKHEKIANYTSSEILTLKENNIDFILLRPDDTSYDQTWYNMSTGEKELDFDGSPYVQKIYGTMDKPIYGKMYTLTNDSLEKVVTEYIYEDIIKDIGTDIKSAKIKEYFSKEVLENFDITFLNEEIDTTKIKENGYIEWNIGTVAGNNSATLKYTLKIKDMNNKNLLDKVISTSEKTELSYINNLGSEVTTTSTDSPKIKLKEQQELEATVTYDPTSQTTGRVIATIKTNKEVNKVEGWTLSEDEKTLTKEYSKNAEETVHLVDKDGMTKDVTIKITNIVPEKANPPKDNTVADKVLPNAGRIMLYWSIVIVTVSGIVAHIRYKKLYK